ncbi:hypothetical protein HY604_00635 [Candidatus Peregrinibacteria bacterium]|nr:hypothetical protein [Candidatus Peregrinibacteria bacterium]
MTKLDIEKNFLNKASLVLFGVFLASIIFSLMIKAFNTAGIYVGIIINGIISYSGFHFCKKKSTLRAVAYGIGGTVVIGIIAYTVVITILKNMLAGI